MRDYRTITVEEFVVDSLDMKMRWLARRLRGTDNPEDIGQWVSVVRSLIQLKQRIKNITRNCTVQKPEVLKPFCEKTHFTISTPIWMEWQSNDATISFRAGTPIPADLELKQNFQTDKLSPSNVTPLPPCIELEEPLSKKCKRTIVDVNGSRLGNLIGLV